MSRQARNTRAVRALLISAIIHLCLMIALTIVFYNDERGEFDDAIGVEFVDEKELRKPRRKLLKPPPLKRLLTPRKVRSAADNQPQTVKLQVSSNPINETMHLSVRSLLQNAIADQIDPQDSLPEVMTVARRLDSREASIPESVASRFQPSDGDGVKSYRQRVQGEGSSGLHAVESTGASDIGIVGDHSKEL